MTADATPKPKPRLDEPTRYRYEKRIKELRMELAQARHEAYLFRAVCSDIHAALCNLDDGRTLKANWLQKQFRRLWR